MKILVTSGGTSEKIDSVRRITNIATGRLGALVADAFIDSVGADVTYVCGKGSILPTCHSEPEAKNLKVITIESVNELKDVITDLLKSIKYDAVIHSMAVSDYMAAGFTSADELATLIADKIADRFCDKFPSIPGSEDCAEVLADIARNVILDGYNDDRTSFTRLDEHGVVRSNKISSDVDSLMLYMRRAPKIIRLIKELQPETILVGFKLTAGVDEETLLERGHDFLISNNCDFVLANDIERIEGTTGGAGGDTHEAMLIRPDMSYESANTKPEIAQMILNVVCKYMHESKKFNNRLRQTMLVED